MGRFLTLCLCFGQCRASLSVVRSLSEAQDYPIFPFVQIRSADTLSRLEPRSDSVPCSRITWPYTGMCALLYFFVPYLFCLFRLNTSLSRGAVGDVTFHSCYVLYPHVTLRHTNRRRESLALLHPCIRAFEPLQVDAGLPCHSALSVVGLP